MLDPIRALLAGALAVAGSAESHLAAVDPNALWNIVHGQCVVEETKAGDPAPCAEVDLSDGQDKGFALLKDIVGKTQFLLIPTRRLEGIESPELLAADTPNYWEDAWKARRFVAAAAQAPLTRDDIGLDVNSPLRAKPKPASYSPRLRQAARQAGLAPTCRRDRRGLGSARDRPPWHPLSCPPS